MFKRAIGFLLVFVLIFSMFTGLAGLKTNVNAATTSQLNIDARANYLYNITWVSQKTVAGWNGNNYFYQGETYRLPYGQPDN